MRDTILIILITVLLIVILLSVNADVNESFTCASQTPTDDQINAMGSTAREACNRISTRAEEIKAHYDGFKGIIAAAQGLFNPLNYKAGDNTTTDVMRNIVNTNLSTCEIQKIQNDCVNSSANVQVNTIDNSKCLYCQTHLCTIHNVTQENKARISQICTLQSAIELLLKKTASVDAQALASVLQESQGLLSGNNTFNKENCNVIAADLSTRQYMESKSACANNLAVDQENTLQFCGDVTDIIQANQFQAYQECLQSSTIKSETGLESNTKVTHVSTVEQSSSGITPLSGAISGIIIFLCILSSSGAYYFYTKRGSLLKGK
jgi:hypothetical protein